MGLLSPLEHRYMSFKDNIGAIVVPVGLTRIPFKKGVCNFLGA